MKRATRIHALMPLGFCLCFAFFHVGCGDDDGSPSGKTGSFGKAYGDYCRKQFTCRGEDPSMFEHCETGQEGFDASYDIMKRYDKEGQKCFDLLADAWRCSTKLDCDDIDDPTPCQSLYDESATYCESVGTETNY